MFFLGTRTVNYTIKKYYCGACYVQVFCFKKMKSVNTVL